MSLKLAATLSLKKPGQDLLWIPAFCSFLLSLLTWAVTDPGGQPWSEAVVLRGTFKTHKSLLNLLGFTVNYFILVLTLLCTALILAVPGHAGWKFK